MRTIGLSNSDRSTIKKSKCVQRFRELKMTKSRNHLFKKLCLCDYCMNEAEYVLVGGAHGVGMTPSGLSRVY